MQEFKVGDKVTHKLTGQKMTIKRIDQNGKVATLIKDIPEPWFFGGVEYAGDTSICRLNNLEHEKTTNP